LRIEEPLAKFIVLPVLEIVKNANLLIRLALSKPGISKEPFWGHDSIFLQVALGIRNGAHPHDHIGNGGADGNS
jgi:hypothetical protein